ncbi:unnamed protein product [Cuscuta epithymum]|uniref:BRI1 kinase inhibitor 1 n=1 Tax=Cuscuta epithymum TaxID=186058 RepID=A0AAV0GC42_9ASTE|nr:unnamed protein product [Cuscuta epithymum]
MAKEHPNSKTSTNNKPAENKNTPNNFKMTIQNTQRRRTKPEEPPSQPPPQTAASPPHLSSSCPSDDEFSFTITLHPSSSTKIPAPPDEGAKTTAKPPTPSFTALEDDLSPADEIFFHGHLLPLRLLSHLPVSARSSTNSNDSFTLPVKDFLHDKNKNLPKPANTQIPKDPKAPKPAKSSGFSLFRLPKRRKDQSDCPTLIKEINIEVKRKEEKEKQWRKLRWDVTQVVKRYMRMVRPLLSSFKNGGGGGIKRERRKVETADRKAHSFSSGSISVTRGISRSDNNITSRRSSAFSGGLRGEYSAPASTRTSPTNSGLLVAQPPSKSTASSDSTMEELHAAIQAAIAHCKNSIAVHEDQTKPNVAVA